MAGWISRFDIPNTIMSDRGVQANLLSSLMIFLDIKRHHTTAYHPQSNGIIDLILSLPPTIESIAHDTFKRSELAR
jgi:transposase InsO family protein